LLKGSIINRKPYAPFQNTFLQFNQSSKVFTVIGLKLNINGKKSALSPIHWGTL
jgi:hypothetical protein